MADRHVYSTALPGTYANEYADLNTAWSAANNDDTIYIHSGTYTGSGDNVNLTFTTKTGVAIRNFEGDSPIFDGGGSVTIHTVQTPLAFSGLHYYNPSFYCIYLQSGADGTQVSGSEFQLQGGSSCIYGDSGIDNIHISGSTFYQYDDGSAPGSNKRGVWSANTDAIGWYILGNVFHSLKQHIYGPATANFFMDGNYHKNIQGARNNTVYAISWRATSGNSVVRNCIFEEMGRGIDYGSGTDSFLTASNNTFIANQYGIACFGRYLSEISNNIFLGNDTAINGDGDGDQPAPEYNCFFDNTADITDYTAAENSVTEDPLLLDPDNEDFSIDDTSPCYNAGKDLTGIVTTDRAGTSRPQGASYDIGAYEVIVPIIQFQSPGSSSFTGSALPDYIIRAMENANQDREKRQQTAAGVADQLDQIPFSYTVPGPFGLRGRTESYRITLN